MSGGKAPHRRVTLLTILEMPFVEENLLKVCLLPLKHLLICVPNCSFHPRRLSLVASHQAEG